MTEIINKGEITVMENIVVTILWLVLIIDCVTFIANIPFISLTPQHLAHVVGPCNSIISGAVLAEAEEDGVDSHPVDGYEAVGGEVGEAGSDEDGSPGVSHVPD